ncbi:EAL domain-containing protein [Aquisalimonas lutea]|uniref:putative bifunctional diguanylate cyclase/phosphodiesterase n=1 Tax=Aquisalimonas lutea TaxID=1327750 RepID=UPI0025B5602E|nr:EAL domain-containing protein [Aquisalimonas lutea]MDN3517441.1 EAL domain-containing protein [Aquisalimonas lutea]
MYFSADSLLQAAFLAGNNPVFLVEMGTRRILACAGTAAQVFGYQPDDLVGRDTRVLHVDDAAYEEFGRASEAILTDKSDSYHGYARMRRRDGTVFPSEHLVRVIRDDQGRPHAAVSIVRDLTHAASRPADGLSPLQGEAGFHALRDRLPGAVYQRVQTPDGTNRFTFLAGSLFRDHGLDPDKVRADPEEFYGRIVPPDREVLEAELARGQASLAPVECEVRMRTPAGQQVSLRILSQPSALDDGSIAWDGFALDVTAERNAEEQFHHLATHDALTGLHNRAQFLQDLQRAVDNAGRHGERLAVVTIGVQAMMQINAIHGLWRGDELLRRVGDRLAQCVPVGDAVARGHGDVFFAVLALVGDQDAGHALDRLIHAFDEPFQLDDGSVIAVSARIGLAAYPEDAEDAAGLLNASTIAFDRSRHGSEVCYEFYAEELGRHLRERMGRERALAEAIDAGELIPYYQPQVSLADDSLVGLEALVRWRRADGTLVSPADFIPLAEESGLIFRIDIAVMKAVVAQIAAWQDAGYEVPAVAVNCSARQFRDAGLVEVYREAIENSGIDPSSLVIEITESSLLDDFQAAETTMTALTGLGIRLSIDDFGTGFSSLNYVARLPFHALKIDRSFIAGLGTDSRQSAISELLVHMGATLGLNVIAEGVEEEAQAAHLRQLGCPAAQGFLYARPLPADAVSTWLSRTAAS